MKQSIYNIYEILTLCGLDAGKHSYDQRKLQRLAKAGKVGHKIIKEYAFTVRDIEKIKAYFNKNK